MPERLIIVGASGRAAAASALRAGFEPFVIDLFADADTLRLCPTLKCDPADYPHGFIELAKQAPPGPWMYTGGLENHPDVVAAISEGRLLWGNGPDVLKLVRDPWVLDSLPKHVAGFAEVAARRDDTAPWGWVRKPLAGAGGGGVRLVDYGDRADDPGVYYQEFIEGEPQSAVFAAVTSRNREGAGTTNHPTSPPEGEVGAGAARTGRGVCIEKPPPSRPARSAVVPTSPSGGEVRWLASPGVSGRLRHVVLGCTLQLVGTPWLHARRFQYAGNVSRPPDVSPISGWAHDLCAATGLAGLFGLDFIGQSVLEVNPRYTASVEVLEFAHGVSILDRDMPPPPARRIVGKAIYYAAAPITFPASGPWDSSLARCTDVWRMPDFADIPHPGSVIEAGQPVFTLFAAAATEEDCVHLLKAKAAACDRLFGVPTPEDDP